MVWRRTSYHCEYCKLYYREVPSNWKCTCYKTCKKCKSVQHWDGDSWMCVECALGLEPEINPYVVESTRPQYNSDVWK